MQIGGSHQSGYDNALTRLFDKDATADPAATDSTNSADDSSSVASRFPSQDDAVRISPQGYVATADDDAGDADNVDDADIGDIAEQGDAYGGTSSEAADQANAQPVKSLVYGTLGLDRPDQPADPNQAYSTGRWIAAGLTLGGIVSLFV